jgi:RNA polymerase sigma factor (sigma-70 family)
VKVFISWSGNKSRAVADALRGWLPGVINSVDPFVSSRDIYAGARWQSEIASQLDHSNFGIVCVTRDNQSAPWLNFEAGALAKAVDLSRVIPLAVDLSPAEIEVPLGQFQAQPANEEGLRNVVESLNNALGENALREELLREAFEVWWPRLDERLALIERETHATHPRVRPERELLEETLVTVRALARAMDRIAREPEPAVEVLLPDLNLAELTPEQRQGLQRAIDALPERERQVLILRFGFDAEGPRTLEEIGSQLNLTRAAVRHLERQALSRLAALRELAAEFAETNEPG